MWFVTGHDGGAHSLRLEALDQLDRLLPGIDIHTGEWFVEQ